MRSASLLILLFFVVLPFSVFAQTYPFKVYTTSDGLAQSAVGCIFQDSRGYLWFGTWGGISRYDGREFRNYGNSALHVRTIAEDSRGAIWVGLFDGLAIIDPGQSDPHFRTDSTNRFASAYVVALLKDNHGNMWVGTDEGLSVVTPTGGRLENRIDSDVRTSYVRALKMDRQGAVLISSDRGIFRCNIVGNGEIETETILRDPAIGDILVSSTRRIFAALLRDRTVISRQNGEWETVVDCRQYGPSVQVRSLGEDAGGNLWVGTTAGIVLLEEGRKIHLSRREGLPNQYVAAIYRDRENIMWFGTEGGALKLPGTSIRSYTHATGLPGDHVISILQDSENSMWFGTYNGAAVLDPAGVMKTISFDPSHLSVQAFTETRHGSIWIGLVDSIARYHAGSLAKSGGGKGPGLRFLQDQEGSVWCGGQGRIVRMTGEGEILLSLDTSNGLPRAGISALFLDEAERLWFGTTSRGAGFYHDGEITLFNERDGLPHGWVTSIEADKHGTLWFGTQQGIVFWNGGRFEPIPTEEEDLRVGIVQFVVRDSSRHLWFGTQRGVYEWDDSLLSRLDTYDGLVADATRSGCVDRKGNLWVGTVGGVSRLNIAAMGRHRPPPPVEIDGLTLDDQPVPEKRASYAHDENTLTLHFNSLSFLDERRTEFQWLLSGFDPTWQPVQLERHVRYTHIPWGSYEFLVRARNRNTGWSDPARFAFVVHPPFWATWWFLSIASIVVLGVPFLAYRWRIMGLEKDKRLQQEFSLRLMESQEAERKRIAGELHDSLGQDLLVIRNRALMALKEPSVSVQVHEQLDHMSAVATQAIDGVRRISHDLRPYQLDRLGLTKAINAIPSGLASSVQFTMDIDSIDDAVQPEHAIHLYRIVQEAINNILKHSQARNAMVTIRREADCIRLAISDDGNGFSPEANGSEPRGFGLVGIAERVKAMNGTVGIASAPGKGTVVNARIPGTGKRS